MPFIVDRRGSIDSTIGVRARRTLPSKETSVKKNEIPFIRAPYSFIISATVLNIINSGGSTF